jgi:hypothetical protein
MDAQAQIAAAQGDAPTIVLPVSAAVPASPPAPPVTPTTAPTEPAPSRPPVPIPVVNEGAAARGMDEDAAPSDPAPSTITRLVIPAIGVDRQVVEVGWTQRVIVRARPMVVPHAEQEVSPIHPR